MVSSSVCMAAGVCALAGSLMLGGSAALAVAAPDSGGTSAHSAGDAQKNARPGVGKFGPARDTRAADRGTKLVPTAAAVSRPVASVARRSGVSPAPVAGATTPVPTSAASAASATQPLTPITDAVESLTSSVTHIPAVITPVTTSLPVVSKVVAPAARAIEQIPVELAPTFQMMAAVEGAMTSVVTSAVPLTRQPVGLAALLGAPTHRAGTDWRPVTAYPAGPVDPLWVSPQPGKSNLPSSPESAGALTSQVSSGVPLMTAPQSTPPATTQADSWLRNLPAQIAHAIREGLKSVSLTELALAALPGLAALFVFFATGIGLGHRQARYGFVMHITGIMRFAPSGPLGVVRSGSFVAVRPRKACTPARHHPETHSRPLDQAG